MSQLSPEKILQTGTAFWASKTLLAAVGMNLFGALADGPKTADELRGALGLHERGALDFLDALHALGFLTREDGRYGNTPETGAFLVPGEPAYVGGMLAMCEHRLYGNWDGLADSLRTGKPQRGDVPEEESESAMTEFDLLYATPEKLRGFLEAMTGISLGAAHAMAAKFPFAEYQSFVDVGCAQGGMPVAIAQHHAHLSGGGFDLPPVQPVFEEYVGRHGLSERLAFHGGDFFNEELPGADVLVMGHILHDWNLEQKKMLLDKAYRALPDGGSLVVYESLIDDDRSTQPFGLLMSLNMLVETEGGFDFTGADCRGWMKNAGFTESRVEHLVGPDFMVVGKK
jgi:hypothetical protein